MRQFIFKKLIIVGFISFVPFILYSQKKADYVRPTHDDSFSFVILGDPQNYVKYDYNQPILELMTAWIADNKDSLRMKGVFCTGDLVDQNECAVPPFPRFGNLSSTEQWTFVSKAFSRLDNLLPYFICTGNHDYGYTRSENSMTHFPEYFPITKNSLWKKMVVSVFNNRNGIPSLENAAYEIEDEHWGKLLILCLEFGPRDEVLDWAKNLATNVYPNHRVIVETHSYLTGHDSQRIGKESYKMTPNNSGQEIWDKLIYPSPNIRFVLSGHYCVPNELTSYSTGFRKDVNIAGEEVYQMMFNCQSLGGGMSGNGGDGWLRLLEFYPDGETIQVRTYSPLFGFSPKTKDLAYRTAPEDQFSFVIKKSQPKTKTIDIASHKNIPAHVSTNFHEFERQYKLNKATWDLAFKFLAKLDTTSFTGKNVVIKKDKCWAITSQYTPKDPKDCKVESHKRYIDLQYVYQGKEWMGRPEKGTIKTPYNEQNDIAFYDSKSIAYQEANPSSFFLFFPGELHQPSVYNDSTQVNKKVVVKIEYIE